MSSCLKVDDLLIDVDSLFNSIDCGITVFRLYHPTKGRQDHHIAIEQFNNECEHIIGVNLDNFNQAVTTFEDLVTPKYKSVLKDVYEKLSKCKDEIQFEVELINFKHKTIYLICNAIALSSGSDDFGQYIRVQSAFMDITKLKIKEEHLNNLIRFDPLTNVLNRAAYEHDLPQIEHELGNFPLLSNEGNLITFVVIDINGLKTINDDQGHNAGDEIIKASANVVKASLDEYGVIYRTGGDEFFAILRTANRNQVRECLSKLHASADKWSGYIVKHMSLSVGSKTCNLPDITANSKNGHSKKNFNVRKLIKIADQRMFEAKRYHYLTKGVDRRIQQSVYDALCNSFQKILRIDLNTDTFNIIKIEFNENDIFKESRNNYSVWIDHFSKSGLIYKNDENKFRDGLSLNHLKDFFKSGKNMFSITYKRKFSNSYKDVLLEVIPEGIFTDSNQAVYLYVKQIEH